jgi:hypothetical protein
MKVAKARARTIDQGLDWLAMEVSGQPDHTVGRARRNIFPNWLIGAGCRLDSRAARWAATAGRLIRSRLARRVRSPTATLIVASIPTVAAMLWGSGNPASDRGVAGAADCRGLSVPRPGTPDRHVTVLKFLRIL